MGYDIKQLKIEAKQEIERADDLKQMDLVYKKYLGKKGKIAEVFSFIKKATPVEKKILGKEVNIAKQELEKMFAEKKKDKERQLIDLAISKEKIDITRTGDKPKHGRLHPITQVQRECEDIFQSMGFEVVLGPEVDSEWYNFDALNVPKDHPARDMQDTFWLKQKISENSKNNFLPRTQTSAVQVRYMEKNNPPIKIIVPGRVFRNEATDASHETQFNQIEGLMVGEDVSAANFKAIMQEFLKRFFKTDIEIRLRPGYFPFTEPSFEMDARQKGGDWLELMGAGMVHPNVFKAAGYNAKGLQGFAFGVGLERLAMVKYKVDDARLFYQNDLRFLKQF
ncbi:MAG: phenylalanine--tRNA ligase subunit alpha [Parcubacteria group bacterium]|nr:phenylalanine--tRNA ligase subunit alpha [Parcubacteria group bacterium]